LVSAARANKAKPARIAKRVIGIFIPLYLLCFFHSPPRRFFCADAPESDAEFRMFSGCVSGREAANAFAHNENTAAASSRLGFLCQRSNNGNVLSIILVWQGHTPA